MAKYSDVISPFYTAGELEREIVLTRVIKAHRERVFQAWVDPQKMFQWFGPEGFVCQVHEAPAANVGVVWSFDMLAPNGHVFDNRIEFVEIIPNERIVWIHGTLQADDPNRFRMTITFDDSTEGSTIVTLRQIHPSPERRKMVIGFGAVELGMQTLDKLARSLDA